MKDEKYSSLGGKDARSLILKVIWNGCKIKNTRRLDGRDEEILKDRKG